MVVDLCAPRTFPPCYRKISLKRREIYLKVSLV